MKCSQPQNILQKGPVPSATLKVDDSKKNSTDPNKKESNAAKRSEKHIESGEGRRGEGGRTGGTGATRTVEKERGDKTTGGTGNEERKERPLPTEEVRGKESADAVITAAAVLAADSVAVPQQRDHPPERHRDSNNSETAGNKGKDKGEEEKRGQRKTESKYPVSYHMRSTRPQTQSTATSQISTTTNITTNTTTTTTITNPSSPSVPRTQTSTRTYTSSSHSYLPFSRRAQAIRSRREFLARAERDQMQLAIAISLGIEEETLPDSFEENDINFPSHVSDDDFDGYTVYLGHGDDDPPRFQRYDPSLSYEDLSQLEDVVVGCDVLQIESLPSSKHVKKDEKKNEGALSDCRCVICLNDFSNGQMLVTLPCFHRFCEPCIKSWLARSKKCPTCKFNCFND